MTPPAKPPLTQAEIDEARIWWNELPSHYKGNASIWTLLALYARHWREQHTVAFASDDEEAVIKKP